MRLRRIWKKDPDKKGIIQPIENFKNVGNIILELKRSKQTYIVKTYDNYIPYEMECYKEGDKYRVVVNKSVRYYEELEDEKHKMNDIYRLPESLISNITKFPIKWNLNRYEIIRTSGKRTRIKKIYIEGKYEHSKVFLLMHRYSYSGRYWLKLVPKDKNTERKLLATSTNQEGLLKDFFIRRKIEAMMFIDNNFKEFKRALSKGECNGN